MGQGGWTYYRGWMGLRSVPKTCAEGYSSSNSTALDTCAGAEIEHMVDVKIQGSVVRFSWRVSLQSWCWRSRDFSVHSTITWG